MTRWRLVCLLLRDADRVSRALVRKLDRLPARRKVHRLPDVDPDRRPAGIPRAQAEVLAVLAAGPLRPIEVAEATGRTSGAARDLIRNMVAAGLIERMDCGRYRAASHAREGER